jgi:hypothetical protein
MAYEFRRERVHGWHCQRMEVLMRRQRQNQGNVLVQIHLSKSRYVEHRESLDGDVNFLFRPGDNPLPRLIGVDAWCWQWNP